MTRFVVIATARRGCVNPPELLSYGHQAMALRQLREDENRDYRADFELAMVGASVVWSAGWDPSPETKDYHRRARPRLARAKLKRLVKLARKAA